MADEVRELLVFGEKTFRVKVPPDAKITFGPFSPPTGQRDNWMASGKAVGTLRIYKGTKDNIIGCFSNVTGFRDLSMEYAEEVAREEGAVIWKSDKDGYQREEKVQRASDWVEPVQITNGAKKPATRRKREQADTNF